MNLGLDRLFIPEIVTILVLGSLWIGANELPPDEGAIAACKKMIVNENTSLASCIEAEHNALKIINRNLRDYSIDTQKLCWSETNSANPFSNRSLLQCLDQHNDEEIRNGWPE